MAKPDYKKGALPFEYVAVPKLILRSSEYQQLHHRSKALLMDLAAQYTGSNNGRLCPSFTVMDRIGWNKGTLNEAKKGLLDCSFYVVTRKGHAPRTAEWIGLTWWKLDYHPSMDIEPRSFAYLNFTKSAAVAMADPNTGRGAPQKTHGVGQKLNRSLSKTALRGSEIEPMRTAP